MLSEAEAAAGEHPLLLALADADASGAVDAAEVRLVKRFDTEAFSDFSGKSSNFRRLVLGCMDSYDSESRRIFQHFSRSTRFVFLRTAPNSEFLQNFITNFVNFSQPIKKKQQILTIFIADFAETRLNFAGISLIIQKMLQNAENLEKTTKKMEKS